jgi:hypothetical protein
MVAQRGLLDDSYINQNFTPTADRQVTAAQLAEAPHYW